MLCLNFITFLGSLDTQSYFSLTMEKNLSLLLSPKHLNYFETMTFIVLQFKAGHESLEIKVASNK
jgi:hypothetical protein